MIESLCLLALIASLVVSLVLSRLAVEAKQEWYRLDERLGGRIEEVDKERLKVTHRALKLEAQCDRLEKMIVAFARQSHPSPNGKSYGHGKSDGKGELK